jgi:hypothetical protein
MPFSDQHRKKKSVNGLLGREVPIALAIKNFYWVADLYEKQNNKVFYVLTGNRKLTLKVYVL